VALEEGKFLDASVRLPDSDWETRFRRLKKMAGVKVHSQPERLGPPPPGTSPFARTNLWMINTALAEAKSLDHLYAILVWDEQPTGDGPGGTSDFAGRIKHLGGQLSIINPTKLNPLPA
jgi:hypothetical protein